MAEHEIEDYYQWYVNMQEYEKDDGYVIEDDHESDEEYEGDSRADCEKDRYIDWELECESSDEEGEPTEWFKGNESEPDSDWSKSGRVTLLPMPNRGESTEEENEKEESDDHSDEETREEYDGEGWYPYPKLDNSENVDCSRCEDERRITAACAVCQEGVKSCKEKDTGGHECLVADEDECECCGLRFFDRQMYEDSEDDD